MNLLDANVLIYAADPTAERHAVARAWLEAALSGTSTVLLPWASMLAFARVTTHPRLFERPLSVETAFAVIDGWRARPNVRVPEPDARHGRRLKDLLVATGGRGNLVSDAHLAALALQEGASVATFDADFSRFRDVRSFAPS